MDYPFWDTGIGYGALMAAYAVLHVFVSHFAIGGGLYLVIAESSARKAGDDRRLEYLEGMTKFFVLVTLVFGALTGVGIWFIIGLINPAATELLIHNFVWGWAIEWTFFVVEIASAIIYFYGWKRMTARNHLVVGWIYFAAAWLSLVVINGIVCFMLTPGRWLETGNFWDGFFNPTYWPSLAFRTAICVVLAGVYAMLVASRQKPPEFKSKLVRYNAVWSMVGLVILVPSFLWYWSAIPSSIVEQALERMPTPIASLNAAYLNAGILAVLVVVFGLIIPRRMSTVVAVLLMIFSLSFFGEFEWMRESIRKPYVVYGYMYGNAVERADQKKYKKDGYLPHIAFRTGDDGADLFRHACRSCHTIGGYKPLAPVFDGTNPQFIADITLAADLLKGNMPPFLGTENEASLIAEHIWNQVDQRPFEQVYGLKGVELGAKVFEVRCGTCHVFGGYRDNRGTLVGLEKEDYDDILDNGADFGDGMPDFTGSAKEREALIQYLLSLEEGGGNS
ncbi:MAG: c-type cytochrome [Candidatus Latescibacterota bacterium]|jgi:mono/diheme cytochrome c family protein